MAAHSSSTGKLNIACESDGDPMKSREDVSGSYQSPTTITSHFSRGRKINQRARSFVVVVAGVVLLVVVSHCKRREIAGRGGEEDSSRRIDESKKNSLPAGSSLADFLLP